MNEASRVTLEKRQQFRIITHHLDRHYHGDGREIACNGRASLLEAVEQGADVAGFHGDRGAAQ